MLVGILPLLQAKQDNTRNKVGYFIEMLIELIAMIWCADNELRNRNIFGESKMERDARKLWAWIFTGGLVLLVVAWLIWREY